MLEIKLNGGFHNMIKDLINNIIFANDGFLCDGFLL
jgi:hypothetical protein